jgi:N-ethylmaleimide reductase
MVSMADLLPCLDPSGRFGIDSERGNRLIQNGLVDLVAFGRPFIANPDLPICFAAGAPLTKTDPASFYGSTEQGYNDYPTLEADRALRC